MTADPKTASLLDWDGPLGTPRFGQIPSDAFLPAFRQAIAEHEDELAAIAANEAPPDFANSIAALERAGARLARVRRLFYALASAQAEPAIHAIEAEASALLAAHGSRTSQDAAMFTRIADVHATRLTCGLSAEQIRLVETVYDGLIAGGAALDATAKARLTRIDARLSVLSVAFGHNVMAATNAWSLVLDADDLAGLPQPVIAAAAARAEAAGQVGRYMFGLGRADYEAFLGFSERRDLREKMWRAFTGRCAGGPHDNLGIIAEILALRQESARLRGYADYPAFKLDGSMASTAEAARALLMRIWGPAKRKAAEEAVELQARIDASREAHVLAPWDWRFHAERIRVERYALDGTVLREHLKLGAVLEAAFATAGRLYGLHFERRTDIDVYHPDVAAWAVTDGDGKVRGILYSDYLARPEKHGGAWMGSLQVQEKLDSPVIPIVYAVANFARASDPADTRLSLDDARTLFHEFGHVLHALLSDVVYPSQAGTAGPRDFVEFPSKLMEHWIVDEAVLAPLGVPDEMIAAIARAETYGQGFASVELTASALVDLAIHSAAEAVAEPADFAKRELDRLGMPDNIVMRHQLPVFTHIFDGGYASAYYSYLWSEVLDWDAFAAFTETGDSFDAATGARFRAEILARGDSRDAMTSFIAFRGRPPQENFLLAARGLLPVS